jgi:hypothetical protein
MVDQHASGSDSVLPGVNQLAERSDEHEQANRVWAHALHRDSEVVQRGSFHLLGQSCAPARLSGDVGDPTEDRPQPWLHLYVRRSRYCVRDVDRAWPSGVEAGSPYPGRHRVGGLRPPDHVSDLARCDGRRHLHPTRHRPRPGQLHRRPQCGPRPGRPSRRRHRRHRHRPMRPDRTPRAGPHARPSRPNQPAHRQTRHLEVQRPRTQHQPSHLQGHHQHHDQRRVRLDRRPRALTDRHWG